MPEGVHLDEEIANDCINTLSLSMLESKHQELLRNAQYFGNQHPENKTDKCLPDPPTQAMSITKQDSDDGDDETVSKWQLRTY